MKKLFAFIFSIFLSVSAFALKVPVLQSYVNDYAGIMKASDKIEAEKLLKSLEDSTGVQFVVLTIPSLNGYSLEDFSIQTAEKNKIGKKGKDNGILLLVSLADRKIRIETGYGIEETLTDTKCGLIIRNIIVPEFRNGNYSKGILYAARNITGIVGGDTNLISEELNQPQNDYDSDEALISFLFMLTFFIIVSCLASGRRNHFLPWIFWSSFGHAYRRNSFYGTSGMHRSSSGFNSSSFNFHGGGGHFGGGGASGGW